MVVRLDLKFRPPPPSSRSTVQFAASSLYPIIRLSFYPFISLSICSFIPSSLYVIIPLSFYPFLEGVHTPQKDNYPFILLSLGWLDAEREIIRPFFFYILHILV